MTHGTIFCDGGARGNPGPAGAAAVLVDEQGRTVKERADFLGEATNNVAEYHGLLLGLKLASAAGVRRLSVKLDSELVARQLTGAYRVKHPGLKPLWGQAQQLLKTFEHWRVEHIPREANAEADRLVNQAIDRHAA